MKDFFTTRHTVRQFTKDVVDDRLLTELIEAASHAPTTGNMQLYSVVVTRSEEGKAALAPTHFDQPCVSGCSVLLTFCADYNRFVKWCNQRNASPGYDNFQSFVTAVLDTVIFAQQFCTLAEMNGLGVCYLGTTTYNAPQIADILGLPAMVVPVVTLAVGYPAAEGKVSDRLPVDGIMHNERYHDYTADDIDRIYSLKESLAESKRFVEENGKQTLAQVFTDVRYTRQACEQFSKIYLDFIRNAGYSLPD
ncbi:MAG: nitroreductase family protein [Paramuribaculum sp.]|nr:nitroreductase family protein [Paramuribaculum sp.]